MTVRIAGSTDTEKRAIIGFVFSNLQLEGEKLRYTLRKPFDLFANLADNQEWRPLLDTLRTEDAAQIVWLHQAIANNNDPRLMALMVA